MAERAPVLLAGGGPVALFLGLALAERDVPFVMCSREASAADRPIALSYGSQLLLDRVGVFGALPATPIHSIHVSQRGGFGRTVIDSREQGVPALGHVVSYAALCAALRSRLSTPLTAATVSHYSPSPQGDRVEVSTIDAQATVQQRSTALLVLADGLGLRTRAPIHPRHQSSEWRRDYSQSAVVAHVRAEQPHANRAWERFTEDGPLALLPDGEELALVWSTTHEKAHWLCGLRDGPFLARLAETFGGRLGRFTDASARSAFPVQLRYQRGSPMPRVLAIGNAAQTLHPVAGQGLNLGLRDAFELAQVLGDAHAAGADPGAASLLHGYVRARELDRRGGIHFTDALVRVFSNAYGPAALARGAGLAALDLMPPLRRFVARRMMFGAQGF